MPASHKPEGGPSTARAVRIGATSNSPMIAHDRLENFMICPRRINTVEDRPNA
jgi:hypothetical protein